MLPSELAAVPWPALLVDANGAVLAVSPAAAALLGKAPGDVAALEARFEPLSPSGRPVSTGDHPVRRITRGEIFEAGGAWRDRESGRELSLRFRGRPAGACGLLEIDLLAEETERRVTERLALLNKALLGRSADEGFISVRELLLELVRLACEISQARYGALGVLAADGESLRDFVYAGVPEDVARAIGGLPVGKGLLGAVVREGRAIRIPDIASDPRFAGFPAQHPPMTSFLGVPLRVGQSVFGNFYLADKQSGGAFTENDARILERFSAQASLTVAYARQVQQEERRLFDAVVRHAPHGIVYFPAHPEGQVLGNPAAERLLGRFTRGNDPDRTYDLRYPGGALVGEEALPSTRALREEAVINLEVVIERHHGRAIPALLSAAPVRSESGAKLGAVVVFQDITAFKQLQQLREDFMALVAHDLRTPLQTVLLQLDAILRRAAGEAASVPVSSLKLIQRSSQRVDRLIRDLLDASQVDARGIHVELAPVALPELASSIVAQIAGSLGTHTVVIDLAGAPPPVLADPLRLEQVLTNLLENSAKYSEEGTPIRIVIAPSVGGATISVEDRGPGISPEELPRLFDRYFQTQRARARRRGLGLGLFIAKGLVEVQGGNITAESTPGVGSTFKVWLPAAPPVGSGSGAG
ncbi:MAG TPA: ATP-binding protein [Anaeromyxobacteraceae bacterium]|nr:ATP-binding protein [Anaeromyxobacteraceae bacterium]